MKVSEWAEFWAVTSSEGSSKSSGAREAYGRPANKRDLGHRCQHCRRPFRTLGCSIVAELQGGGPVHRFHEECWRRRDGGEQRVSLCGIQRSGSAPGVAHAPMLVAAYAEEWRRAVLDDAAGDAAARSLATRKRSSSTPHTAAVLEGLATISDASGERRLARGFTPQQIVVATARWGCSLGPEDECAICLAAAAAADCSALRLPCGHAFCKACVKPWLERCGLCPTCRNDARSALEHSESKPRSAGQLGCRRLSPLVVAGGGVLPSSR